MYSNLGRCVCTYVCAYDLVELTLVLQESTKWSNLKFRQIHVNTYRILLVTTLACCSVVLLFFPLHVEYFINVISIYHFTIK